MKHWLLALALLAACGDDKSTDPTSNVSNNTQGDVGGDASGSDASDGSTANDSGDAGQTIDPHNPGLSRTPEQAGVSADGADGDTLVDVGARVGRITGETGFHGLWAHCRRGDLRLYNEHVELCVQGETTNRNEMFSGGSIVDLRLRGDTREDTFDLLKPRNGFNVQFASEVKIVRDGTDGGPAVIRVTGYDTPVAYLLGIVEGRIFKSEGLEFTTEYRLRPDSHEVEIVSWLHNPTQISRNAQPGEWLAVGDRAEVFRDKYGFAPTNLAYRWLTTVAGGPNIAWYGESDMQIDELPFDEGNPWLLTRFQAQPLPPDATYAWRRWLAIGDGTMGSTFRPLRKRIDATTPELRTVRVLDADGNPVPGRRVTATSKAGDEDYFFGVTDANGEFQATWPAAAVLTVEPDPGFEATTQMVDGAGTDAVEITVPSAVNLSAVLLLDGQPMPGLVRVRGAGVDTEFFALPGHHVRLAPGEYTVQASRGMEYDVVEQVVTVGPEGLNLEIPMTRSVDTKGYIAADFHQHMEPSTDSAVSVRARVTDNVCEGIEFVASTDHDVVTDLQPWIDELGFTALLNAYPGVEISPRAGHVGVYPIPYDATQRGNGGISLAYLDAGEAKYRAIPDVFAAARAMSTNPVVQLNHPRGGTSLFDTTNFDPNTDNPTTFAATNWSTDFDTVEVINRFPSTCATFADLAQFLNVGLKKTGLGNSDTHTLRGNPAGVPRNYIVSSAEPGAISGEDITAAMKAGQVTVGAHAFIAFSDNLWPGETRVGDTQTFNVRVQTPSYSQATRLHVIVNGKVVQSLDRTGNNGFDFDEAIELAFDADSWVIFFAVGPKGGAWEYGDTTLAFTNAVYVDVDGDGWQAPGMQTLELDALNESGFCE